MTENENSPTCGGWERDPREGPGAGLPPKMHEHWADEDGVCRTCGADVITALEVENYRLREALKECFHVLSIIVRIGDEPGEERSDIPRHLRMRDQAYPQIGCALFALDVQNV